MNGRVLGSAVSRCVAITLALSATEKAVAQTQVLVQYESEMLPVVAMDGETPLVEVDKKRVPVQSTRVTVVGAEYFTDGAVEVLERDAVMGQSYGSSYGSFFFRFDATVKAQRDFEDCFVLFAITPQQGEATYVMREIADIDTNGTERILVTIPVNPSFGGGTFGYMLYSRGEEIRRIEAGNPVSIRQERGEQGARSDEAGSRDRGSVASPGAVGEVPRAIDPRLLNFPESLKGELTGGYVEAVYSIDENGRAFEILELRADHADLLPEALKTIVQTRYQPAYLNGEPLVTTIRQRFYFNEYASFAEEMVMIPYPDLADAPPRAVYAPLPEVPIYGRMEVKVETTIDRLGRTLAPQVMEAPNDEIADATLSKVKNWIFLPGVRDGYPVEQKVTFPVYFNPAP